MDELHVAVSLTKK